MFSKIQLEEHVQSLSTIRSPEVDDSTLWLRFRNGNDLAFSIIYSKYVQKLYNYGMHACRDREQVLDCLQELFSRLWDKRSQLSNVDAVNYYLFKSFRRLLLSRVVQQRKFSFIRISKDESGFDFNPSIEEALILEEATSQQIEELRKAVNCLTKRQREAIFLKFYNDLTYSEVASIMEMSIDSVYNLVSKAIDGLRKNMKTGYACLPIVASFDLFQKYF